jgi:hypothetical protein
MALRSLTLKDDPALQACLLHDKDHVVPGARGNHVAKIQKALLLLEKADIQPTEMQLRTYGPTTASSVLAYKTKREIINRSYQTKPDNIVGKMTIARLDEDLLEREQRVTPDRFVCVGGGPGGVASSFTSASGVVGAPALRRQNASLSILFQTTSAADAFGGFQLGVELLARARDLMAPHGIKFQDGLFLDFVGPRVPDFDNVIPGSPASCFSVRAAAERVLPGRAQTLRVIFCPFDDKGEAFGVTDGGTLGDWTFPKFCLINVKKNREDHGTLLHEMIHASKPVRIEHDDDAKSVFTDKKTFRTFLPAEHATSLANGFFSTVRL